MKIRWGWWFQLENGNHMCSWSITFLLRCHKTDDFYNFIRILSSALLLSWESGTGEILLCAKDWINFPMKKLSTQRKITMMMSIMRLVLMMHWQSHFSKYLTSTIMMMLNDWYFTTTDFTNNFSVNITLLSIHFLSRSQHKLQAEKGLWLIVNFERVADFVSLHIPDLTLLFALFAARTCTKFTKLYHRRAGCCQGGHEYATTNDCVQFICCFRQRHPGH